MGSLLLYPPRLYRVVLKVLVVALKTLRIQSSLRVDYWDISSLSQGLLDLCYCNHGHDGWNGLGLLPNFFGCSHLMLYLTAHILALYSNINAYITHA
jgi:hypothetical protein